jgi:hypothetical protein
MEDNQSAIKIAHNPEDRKRTRHIDIRHHFIRQLVDKESIRGSIQWVLLNE